MHALIHSGLLPRPYHPPSPPHPRRHPVTSPLFHLASTLDATTTTLSMPQPLYPFSRTSRVSVFMDDPARILRCRAPTAVHWRSHRTLSFSVRASVDAFERSR
ncbi:hypothetical protein JCM10296v2_006927 [Rhodotorula toruloides]